MQRDMHTYSIYHPNPKHPAAAQISSIYPSTTTFEEDDARLTQPAYKHSDE